MKEFAIEVYGYDPLLSKEEIERFEVTALDNLGKKMDCVIVAVAHDKFKDKPFLSTGSFFRKKVLNDNPVLIDRCKRFIQKPGCEKRLEKCFSAMPLLAGHGMMYAPILQTSYTWPGPCVIHSVV
jgi:hypothetical protein